MPRIIDDLLSRNYERHYAKNLEVPGPEFRARVLATPEIDRTQQGTAPLAVSPSAQGPVPLDLRTHPYTLTSAMVEARGAYQSRQSFRVVRGCVDRAIAQAKTPEEAMVVAQFAYDHVFRGWGSSRPSFGEQLLGLVFKKSSDEAPASEVTYYGLQQALERAVDLAKNQRDASTIVAFALSLHEHGPTGPVQVARGKAISTIADKLRTFATEPKALLAALETLPLASQQHDALDVAWSLVAHLIASAKNTDDLALAARGLALFEQHSTHTRGLAWALERKRENPSAVFEMSPWGVREAGSSAPLIVG